MASVPSTSSATQNGLQQLMLQQAKRNADQAQQTAQSLKAQADDAQHVAVRAQENARSLSVEASQAEQQAGQASRGLAALGGLQQAMTQLSNTVDQALARKQASATPSSTTSPRVTPPVVNSQGQLTGKIITVTA